MSLNFVYSTNVNECIFETVKSKEFSGDPQYDLIPISEV